MHCCRCLHVSFSCLRAYVGPFSVLLLLPAATPAPALPAPTRTRSQLLVEPVELDDGEEGLDEGEDGGGMGTGAGAGADGADGEDCDDDGDLGEDEAGESGGGKGGGAGAGAGADGEEDDDEEDLAEDEQPRPSTSAAAG